MKLSNMNGLPDLIVSAVEESNSLYDKGKCDISITEMIGPPRISVLKREGKAKSDVADSLFALQGSAMHSIIELAANREPGRYLSEERYFQEIDGWIVSGQYDLIDCKEQILADLKFAGITTYKYGVKPEYVAQLNCLAYILRQHDFTFKKLQSWAMYRDFSKMKTLFGADYPECGFEVHSVEMWTDAKCLSFMQERIALHRDARENGSEPCSRSERFQKPEATEYCIQKKGAKKPYRVKDSRVIAEEFKNSLKKPDDYEIIERQTKSEPVRCALYCDVAASCDFGQQVFAEKQAQHT